VVPSFRTPQKLGQPFRGSALQNQSWAIPNALASRPGYFRPRFRNKFAKTFGLCGFCMLYK